ncbi:hypothetical protein HK098_005783 [Nowakowskiella sp. JEL0407]|nr:hypothetical protein HK098_005783 [Nowakowskiella sp. JEL0407]
MVKLSTLLVVAASTLSVNAHYYVNQVNGGTGALRPIALRQGGENSPVTGSQITTDDMICNVARPFSARASAPLQIAAGSTIKVHYDTGVFHTGPCHVYIGEGLKPSAWAKIYEIRSTPKWCSDVINANGNTLDVPIPASLAPGSYVVRVDHIGLHQAGTAGGAQFYPRCFDIDVISGGNLKPPYNVPIPGSWTGSTPGYVIIDVDGQPQSVYPYWGGQLWDGKSGSSGGSGTVQSPSPVRNSPSPVRSSPSPVRSSPASSSCTGSAVALYGQCGGSTYAVRK